MERPITSLDTTHFNVVIYGDCITKACFAWDAIIHGLTVSLINKSVYDADETLSAYSKLHNDSILYRQQGKIIKVRESALNRVVCKNITPNLTCYNLSVIPVYKNLLEKMWVLCAELLEYQLIDLGQNRYLQDMDQKFQGWKNLSEDQVADCLWIPLLSAALISDNMVNAFSMNAHIVTDKISENALLLLLRPEKRLPS